MLYLSIALFLGIFAGTITGLTPGIHVNLVGIILLSLTTTLLISIPLPCLIVFITALAITHTFIDFIPSIFLGCPDTDTELSILPGHELLKEGKGYEAIMLTTYGSISAIIILIIFLAPSLFLKNFISSNYYLFKPLIPGLLILASLFLISLEKNKPRAFFVFTITGLLGLCVLNLETLKEPLLPLLTGLFGSSMLILSIKNKVEIPKQELTKPKINPFGPILASALTAPLCSFLPGLGSGQAAIIGNSLIKSNDKKSFLLLLGTTNTLVMGFSFISLYIISKTRTGAAATIQQIANSLDKQTLILIILTTFLAGIIAFFLASALAEFFAQNISKFNYTKLSIIILAILLIIVLAVSKPFGILVLIISTLTGIYCISLGVRRTNMMGCLIIPTIILYLF